MQLQGHGDPQAQGVPAVVQLQAAAYAGMQGSALASARRFRIGAAAGGCGMRKRAGAAAKCGRRGCRVMYVQKGRRICKAPSGAGGGGRRICECEMARRRSCKARHARGSVCAHGMRGRASPDLLHGYPRHPARAKVRTASGGQGAAQSQDCRQCQPPTVWPVQTTCDRHGPWRKDAGAERQTLTKGAALQMPQRYKMRACCQKHPGGLKAGHVYRADTPCKQRSGWAPSIPSGPPPQAGRASTASAGKPRHAVPQREPATGPDALPVAPRLGHGTACVGVQACLGTLATRYGFRCTASHAVWVQMHG